MCDTQSEQFNGAESNPRYIDGIPIPIDRLHMVCRESNTDRQKAMHTSQPCKGPEWNSLIFAHPSTAAAILSSRNKIPK